MIITNKGDDFDVGQFRCQIRELLGSENPEKIFEKDGVYNHAVAVLGQQKVDEIMPR